MSTKADRAFRATRRILPVKIGSQHVDTDARQDKRALPGSAAFAARYAVDVNRALRALSAKCPHCGNADHALIETNGCQPNDPDFTLLCIARVDAGEEASADFDPKAEPDADGTVACGMQWCPSD